MKAMVGSSILSNSYDAGVETIKNSLRGLKSPKIGFLFSSTKHNSRELVKGIKSINYDIKVIGCNSNEMIMTPEGIITGDDGFVGMLALEDNELTIGVALAECNTDPRSTGRTVAREAMVNAEKKYPPVAFAMFATGDEEEYLKGIQDVLGEINVFGGGASTYHNIEPKVFCEDKETSNGVAIAVFYTSKEIANIFTGDFEETDNVGVITKTNDSNCILEIDNEPALKKYASWIGSEPEALINDKIKQISAISPLGVKNSHSNLIEIKHPLKANADLSIEMGTQVSPKTAVILMKNDIDGLIEGTIKAIRQLDDDIKPAALLLVQSTNRKLYIEDRIDEMFVAIKNAAGDTPFIAVFTNREYGQMNHSGATVSNLSLSFTSFYE